MQRQTIRIVVFLAVCALFSTAAWSDTFPVGYISWDVNFPGNAGQFDISNQTGPNSSPFPDPTWPVSTLVNLSSLSLMVDFSNATTVTYGPSYFTLAADGESFNGSPIPIGGTNPQPVDATLTGMFSPLSITLNDGSTDTIDPSFSASFSDSPTLMDGDFAIINATSSSTVPPIPEPGSFILLATCISGIALSRRQQLRSKMKTWLASSGKGAVQIALLVGCLVLAASTASAIVLPAVHLNAWTTPDNGTAGINDVNITGSGFPAGTITPANVMVTLSTTCGGAPSATAAASSIKNLIGTSKRVDFLIPGTLSTGTYFVQIADSSLTDSDFTSGNCSEVNVTHTNPTLSACLPTSSLGVLVPTTAGKVTAYVPNGCWDCSTTGIQAVDIEGGAAKTSIATASTANSCSANPATGEVVCVANNTDVYLITGTTLNSTLSSSATFSASFSGGSCANCGVAINALTNKAAIAGGFGGVDGVQLLDLGSSTFSAPFVMHNEVSEDILIDPTRNLIVTPGESGNFTLLQIQADGTTLKEFSGPYTGLTNDSAAEDCSTGIAATPGEFSNSIWIEDLTQAVFTPGSPGSYTAPGGLFTVVTPLYGSFAAGASGLSVAPGTSHLAVLTGEFGGNVFAVLQFPSTSGSGTPTVSDYAVAAIPSSAACGTFSAGLDPHTITAYTSPNDGKAYALFANSPPPSCVVRIDLAAVLAAPRNAGSHDVSAANFPAAAATFYTTH